MDSPSWCRALVLDYDGTLTVHGRPQQAVLDRLATWRAGGGRLVLATGRILDHLLEEFADVPDYVDLVVAENGAVIWDGRRCRLLGPPVDEALWRALLARGIPCRRGAAILATHGIHTLGIEAAIHELGLDVQLVQNRTELMVLPAGISKGTGVRAALRVLGLSPHSAVAIGDAENDLALLQVCELGVAVANAVPTVRRAADFVTEGPDAAGVAEVIDGLLLRTARTEVSSRWQVQIGLDPDGAPVTIPASRVDVLVCGRSGGGKSYVAGLIAERLIELDYSMLIVDPEGDHNALRQLPGVLAVGVDGSLPSVDHLTTLLQQHLGTVTVDLSLQCEGARDDFYRHAPVAIEQLRATRGVPHWIFLDEAHTPLRREDAVRRLFDSSQKGHLLVTFDPGLLPQSIIDQIDIAVIMPGPDNIEAVLRSFSCDKERYEAFAAGALTGDVIVLRRTAVGTEPELARARTQRRITDHVRHLHKYTAAQLPDERRFYFRNRLDEPVGRPAANIMEFHNQITYCPNDVIEHHLRRHDFSRWIGSTLGDQETAKAIEDVENSWATGGGALASLDFARGQILAAIERRYAGNDRRVDPDR